MAEARIVTEYPYLIGLLKLGRHLCMVGTGLAIFGLSESFDWPVRLIIGVAGIAIIDWSYGMERRDALSRALEVEG